MMQLVKKRGLVKCIVCIRTQLNQTIRADEALSVGLSVHLVLSTFPGRSVLVTCTFESGTDAAPKQRSVKLTTSEKLANSTVRNAYCSQIAVFPAIAAITCVAPSSKRHRGIFLLIRCKYNAFVPLHRSLFLFYPLDNTGAKCHPLLYAE
jgi:hypothetical protein